MPPAPHHEGSPALGVDAAAPTVVLAQVDAAVAAPPAPEAPACRKLLLAPGACLAHSARPKQLLTADEQSAWFRTRGAKRPPTDAAEPPCYAIEVGPANEPALACDETTRAQKGAPGSSDHVFRVLHRVRIHVVRGGRALTVFDQPEVFDIFDKEDLDDGPLFGVSITLSSPQGTTVEVAEPGADACTDAKRRLADGIAAAKKALDRPATAVRWATFDMELVTRLCAGVGRYVWKDGIYTRAHPPPSSPSGGATSL